MCIAHSFAEEGAGASQTLHASEAVSDGPQKADAALGHGACAGAPLMTMWVRAQQPGRSLGALVLFLVISCSSVALASRPLDHAAQLQQQQQHK